MEYNNFETDFCEMIEDMINKEYLLDIKDKDEG